MQTTLAITDTDTRSDAERHADELAAAISMIGTVRGTLLDIQDIENYPPFKHAARDLQIEALGLARKVASFASLLAARNAQLGVVGK